MHTIDVNTAGVQLFLTNWYIPFWKEVPEDLGNKDNYKAQNRSYRTQDPQGLSPRLHKK